jgi:hypothetical protein
MQQEFVTTASGDDPRCPSLPGAGAKQEPRLFWDLPGLLSTAADGLVTCRILYFRRSAHCVDNPEGEVASFRQVKELQFLTPGRCDHSFGNPVYWHEGGGGAPPGFSGELRVQVGGDGSVAAG